MKGDVIEELNLVAHLAHDGHDGADDQERDSDPEQEHCSLHCNAEHEKYDSDNDKCDYDSHRVNVPAGIVEGNKNPGITAMGAHQTLNDRCS